MNDSSEHKASHCCVQTIGHNGMWCISTRVFLLDVPNVRHVLGWYSRRWQVIHIFMSAFLGIHTPIERPERDRIIAKALPKKRNKHEKTYLLLLKKTLLTWNLFIYFNVEAYSRMWLLQNSAVNLILITDNTTSLTEKSDKSQNVYQPSV